MLTLFYWMPKFPSLWNHLTLVILTKNLFLDITFTVIRSYYATYFSKLNKGRDFSCPEAGGPVQGCRTVVMCHPSFTMHARLSVRWLESVAVQYCKISIFLFSSHAHYSLTLVFILHLSRFLLFLLPNTQISFVLSSLWVLHLFLSYNPNHTFFFSFWMPYINVLIKGF